jgi:hypothetical protein
MCEKCKGLDRSIESFRRLQKMADDSVALALIAEAITDLEAEKILAKSQNPHKPSQSLAQTLWEA